MLRLTVIACLVAAAVGSDPKCETGIEDADKQVCCAKSCGKCGGENCQAHPGEAILSDQTLLNLALVY